MICVAALIAFYHETAAFSQRVIKGQTILNELKTDAMHSCNYTPVRFATVPTVWVFQLDHRLAGLICHVPSSKNMQRFILLITSLVEGISIPGIVCCPGFAGFVLGTRLRESWEMPLRRSIAISGKLFRAAGACKCRAQLGHSIQPLGTGGPHQQRGHFVPRFSGKLHRS